MKKVLGKLETFINNIKAKIHAFLLRHGKINRVVTLVLLQRKNSKKLLKPKTFLDQLLIFVLKLGIFVGLFFLFKLAIFYLPAISYLNFAYNHKSGNFTLLFFWIYLIVSIVTVSIAFVNNLYRAKDNALLLSYPVEIDEIYTSKLLVELIKEYKKAIFIIIPYFFAFFFEMNKTMHLGPGFIFGTLGLFILVPIIVVFISGIVSISFTYISTLFKRFELSKIIFFVLVIVGLSILTVVLVNKIPYNLPIRQLWMTIANSLTDFVNSIIKYSVIARFAWLGMTKGKALLYLAFVGIAVVAVLINVFLCYRLYIYLVYQPIKEKKVSVTLKSKSSQSKHVFFTFLKKELRSYLRSENGFISTFVYVLIMPLLIYCLNRIFFSLSISSVGYNIIISVNLMISITLITASNISVANALSCEGSEFYLLKVSPIETKHIAFAKILVNFVLTTLSIIGMGFVLWNVNSMSISLKSVELIKTKDIIGICFVVLLVCFAHIMWSLELDITNSKVKQVIEGEKENNNVGKSLFIGLGLALVFTFFNYFLMSRKFYGASPTALASLLILAGLVFVARGYLFVCKLNAYFDDITF